MLQDNVKNLLGDLKKQGCDDNLLQRVEKLAAVEAVDAGIIRTSKGALMVRVGATRWPIAMYKNDWQILLSKIPLIEEALEELDIADENPERADAPTPIRRGREHSVQVSPSQKVG